jgi:glycogen synthase
MIPSTPGRPNKQDRTVVFVSFETGLAPSGGLAAVMKVLPKEMAKCERCLILAPYFENITRPLPLLRTFSLPVASSEYPVEIRDASETSGIKTYLLSSTGLFTAPSEPYVNPENPDKLVEDALFFCAAVPYALEVLAERGLARTEDLVLNLQDWETACTAQAIRMHPGIGSAACVLTLHNPYDRYLGSADSPLLSDLIVHLGLRRDNVLSQMIPLTDGPLSTVSQNFADELTGDPLHSQVFANHLQGLLASKGVVGIDNGIFGYLQFPFSDEVQHQAERGTFEPLQQEKWARREKLGQVLERYQRQLATSPRAGKESWGEDLTLTDPRLPVFLLMGRDDPRQKGFDVVAEAIRRIPAGRARYIFTPMPGAEGFEGLAFLRELAAERPGEVKVFPFRLDPEPFTALKEGSSFMVMGSLYEPFGAANEAYLAGMPVVARATGGLVQQVVPYPSASLSRQGQELAALFHERSSEPTGFLFREPAVPNVVQGWQTIVDCAYWNQDPKGDRIGDRIGDRRGTPLFDAMVQRAAWALQDAIDFYLSDQAGYARMIYHGYRMLDNFGWDRAVREYRRLYDRVCDL